MKRDAFIVFFDWDKADLTSEANLVLDDVVAVANGLIARGIAPGEIVIRAFGEENPLVPTPYGVREPQNRRVEIFLS